MFTFLVKRLFQALIVMFVISLVAFAIQDNLGDPLRELVGQSVSEAERQQLRDDLHFCCWAFVNIAVLLLTPFKAI